MKKFIPLFLLGLYVTTVYIVYLSLYGIDLFSHMTSRESIHVWAGPGVYLASLFGFWTLERKIKHWPNFYGWSALIYPGVVLLGIMTLVEYTIPGMQGPDDPLMKSFIDIFVGWNIGFGGGVYGLYRINPYLDRAVREIKKGRNFL